MRRDLKLLCMLFALALAIQPAMADRFFLCILDESNGTPIGNAFVQVWQNDNRLDEGYADVEGIFSTSLNTGEKYNIKVQCYGSTFDRTIAVDSSRGNRIEVRV